MATNNKINSNFYQIAITDANGNVTGLNLDTNTKLAGGTPGQVLQTIDGLGNLQWATVSAGALANGTSNVEIPLVNGNVNITAGGNTTVVVTDVGANVTGNLAVTGDISAANGNYSGGLNAFDINVTDLYVNGGFANLGAVGQVHITGGNVGEVLTTDGLGGLSWAAAPTPTVTLDDTTAADIDLMMYDGNLKYTSNITINPSTSTVKVATANLSADLNVLGKSNLNSVGNVTITGGAAGQYLQTDGTGVLSWANANPISVPELEWSATADGTGQVFADAQLAYYNSLANAIGVFKDGIKLSVAAGDYSLAGTSLTINTWIGTGSIIAVGAGVRLV